MNKFFSIVVLIILCPIQMLAYAQSGGSPSVPASLAATVVSSSQINLTWTASTDTAGVNGYDIYRGGTLVGTSATAFYTDISLTPSTTYTYTVSAYDAVGNNSVQSASASAITQAAGPVLPFDLQVDLGGLDYWSTEVPFKDLMFQSTGWQAGPSYVGSSTCLVQPQTDADGYPLALDPTCAMHTFVMLGNTPPPGVNGYPAGHYVLIYQGSGDIYPVWDAVNVKNMTPGRIEFDVVTPTSSGPQVVIKTTNPNNYIHDVHMFLASDETTYKAQPFRQEFLNALAPFKILRMMDWSGVSLSITAGSWTSGITQIDATHVQLPSTASSVDGVYTGMVAMLDVSNQWPRLWISGYGEYEGLPNVLTLASPAPVGTLSSVTIYQFPNQTWAQRTPTDVLQQQGGNGVAYEYMVQLANTTGKDLWINVPTAADDDYVTQLATFLKTNLNPNLKIYIEYSNETWNYGYPGYHYSEAMMRKIGNTGSSVWIPADEWQAYRVVQIFHLFNQVFGEQDLRVNRPSNDRLVRIITGQTGWTARYLDVIDWENTGASAPTYGHHASEYADAMAVTDYWTVPSTVTADPLTLSIAQLETYQKQAIDDEVASTSPSSTNYLYPLAQAAQARGLKLIQYEGQEGFTTPYDQFQRCLNDLKVTNAMCPATLPSDCQNLPAAPIPEPAYDGCNDASGNPKVFKTWVEMNSPVYHFTQMNRDAGMKGVYDESLSAWNQLAQEFPGVIGDWAQFNDIGNYTQYGFWGLLESVFQDPTTVPRYQGILDYTSGTLTGATVVNEGLTVNISGNGTVLESVNGVAKTQPNFPSGTVVVLTANPLAGYQFSGWSGDEVVKTNPITVTLTNNMNVTANFSQIPLLTVKTINNRILSFHPINNRVDLSATNAPVMTTSLQGNSNAVLSSAAIPTEIVQMQRAPVSNDFSIPTDVTNSTDDNPPDSDNSTDSSIYKNSIE